MTKICLFSYIDNKNMTLKREIANIIGGYTEVSYSKTKYDGSTYSKETFIKDEFVNEFAKFKLLDDSFKIITLMSTCELFLFNLSIEERAKLVTNEEVIKHTRIVYHSGSKNRIIVVSGHHGTYEEIGR